MVPLERDSVIDGVDLFRVGRDVASHFLRQLAPGGLLVRVPHVHEHMLKAAT